MQNEQVLSQDQTPFATALAAELERLGTRAAGSGEPPALELAEQLGAESVGAQRCWYLPTGVASAMNGAVAALAETVGLDGSIAVQSSLPPRVFKALTAAGANIVTIPTEMSTMGVATMVIPEVLRASFARFPAIKGVIVSGPSRHGALPDNVGLVTASHEHGAAVMSDATWGHEANMLPFGSPCPFDARADVIVTRPGEILQAPREMACVYRMPGSRISEVVLDGAVDTTPSMLDNIHLAQLDVARRDAAAHGVPRIESLVATIAEQQAELYRRGFGSMVVDWPAEGVQHRLAYRVVLRTSGTGATGYEIASALNARGVLADGHVAYISRGFRFGDEAVIREMFTAIVDVVERLEYKPALDDIPIPPLLEHQEVDLRELVGRGVEIVELGKAVGRTSKYPVGADPEGPCVALPGLKVTPEAVGYLEAIAGYGGTLHGSPKALPSGHIAVTSR